MARPLHLLGALAVVVAVLLLLWCGGLAWFVVVSLRPPADASLTSDAIVVLTGGRQRIETGVQLLAAGRGKKLFISGVNQRVDRDELLHALGPLATHEACCIMLGHDADNTIGNARETAGWMRAESYGSLRLVTSWYHIERGLLEFRRAMPDVIILAHPVFPPHAEPERWWGRHGTALLILAEYHKYLAAWFRPALELVLPARLAETVP